MDRITQLIADGLDALGLAGTVPENAPEKLAAFDRLLLERNQVMNLTAITDPEQSAVLHMLDSAALLACPGVDWSGRLLDVGSGAGLPGLALGILLPDLEVTLLDSQEKRVGWLRDAAAALGLSNVTAVHARAEYVGRDPLYREAFPLVTARAVADLRVLAELCLPFVTLGGRFLAMKGPDPAEELDAARAAIETLGGGAPPVWTYQLPGGARHSVLTVEKTAPTPEKYPRKWKRISTNPL